MKSFNIPTLPNSVVVFSLLHLLVCHKPQGTSFQNTSVYKGANKYLPPPPTVYSWLEWSLLHRLLLKKESWIKSIHKRSSLKSSFKNIELFCIRSGFNACDVMILFSEFKRFTSLFLHIKKPHVIKRKNGWLYKDNRESACTYKILKTSKAIRENHTAFQNNLFSL